MVAGNIVTGHENSSRVRARGRSRSSRKGEPMGAENTLRDTGWSFSHSGTRSTRGLQRRPGLGRSDPQKLGRAIA